MENGEGREMEEEEGDMEMVATEEIICGKEVLEILRYGSCLSVCRHLDALSKYCDELKYVD